MSKRMETSWTARFVNVQNILHTSYGKLCDVVIKFLQFCPKHKTFQINLN